MRWIARRSGVVIIFIITNHCSEFRADIACFKSDDNRVLLHTTCISRLSHRVPHTFPLSLFLWFLPSNHHWWNGLHIQQVRGWVLNHTLIWAHLQPVIAHLDFFFHPPFCSHVWDFPLFESPVCEVILSVSQCLEICLDHSISNLQIDSQPLNASAIFIADIIAKMQQPPYNCADCTSVDQVRYYSLRFEYFWLKKLFVKRILRIFRLPLK